MTTAITKPKTRSTTLPAGTARIRKGTVQLSRPKYDGLKISRQDFLEWEREPDGWKYEWNNSIIEINERNMIFQEQYIVANILSAFNATKHYHNGNHLLAEVDCEFSETLIRRPDISYYTKEQIRLGRLNAHPVPEFVIELVSKNDKLRAMHNKITEYFAHGVRCVWYIFPEEKRVDAYTSIKNVQICTDNDVCTTAPVLDFSMSIQEIFA
ncbi:MAG: Uma2 family endonuclease [Candidatus Kapabacteria bacterium]|jgi:Uma2 family endonuclease|nr:Uma2 family endonuclease [Candidatus Kapabacteria bacterium]